MALLDIHTQSHRGFVNCGLNLGEPIASNLEVQAVFYLTYEEGSHQEGSQYLIRYTP